MGKLVLYLPDGTLHDIPLDKERVSIGRRPDNDVCLPYPAVSGEHAAVVNILDDSFLEDLGSTNGTVVNGKAIVKHFLRDNDLIDIGRQRLVYFSDVNTRADPLPPDILRRDIQGLQEQVERARSPRPPEPRKPPVAAPGASGPRTADPLSPDDELLADLETAGFPATRRSRRPRRRRRWSARWPSRPCSLRGRPRHPFHAHRSARILRRSPRAWPRPGPRRRPHPTPAPRRRKRLRRTRPPNPMPQPPPTRFACSPARAQAVSSP
jgi:hypothetical protein